MKLIYFIFCINIILLFFVKLSYATDIPEWILSPSIQEYSYCAIGSAPKNSDISLQKKIARINAMSELSKTIEINITNELEIKNKIETSNNQQINISKDASSSSRHNSNTLISNALEINNFLDNNTGIYYLIMCIK